VLKRVLSEFAELGLHPVVGPELEFYLFVPDSSDPRGYSPYALQDSPVYTVGEVADPKGTLRRMLDAAVGFGLDAIAAAHEYGRSQYEINLRHSAALDSADRAFRFKYLVKEMAARDGLLATFMGKPLNGDEGSGFHIHISLVDGEGNNCCEDAEHPSGLADATRHFLAGVIEHGPAMMVFFNPTVNAYRRISAEALVPTRACWGHDHRMTLVRVPGERGAATRLEFRLGDGAANVYLAYAGRGLSLRPARGGAGEGPPDQLRERAGCARRRRGDRRRARGAADRDLRDDQGSRARALPDMGHRLGLRRIRPPALSDLARTRRHTRILHTLRNQSVGYVR
jgi:glutamine synthetase